MPFTGEEMMFCAFGYSETQLIKTAQYGFVREFAKNADLDMAQNFQGTRLMTWCVPCHRMYAYWKLVKSFMKSTYLKISLSNFNE